MSVFNESTELWYWLSPLVAFLVAALSSMGGVSGAFLLLPFQMSILGITSPSVSATNQLFNVVAIPSGVVRYIREGRMVLPLTGLVVAGTLPGVLLGTLIRVRYLPDPSRFKLFAAMVLLTIGGRMAWGALRPKGAQRRAEERFHTSAERPGRTGTPSTRVVSFGLSHLEYAFQGSRYRVSSIGVLVLCLVVGIVGGIYGIGGGAIIAPVFITVFGLPVYTIAGATLMGTFAASVAGVVFYQAVAPFYPHLAVTPDWTLGLLLGAGGAVGMYTGARLQKRVAAKIIKWILAAVILFVSVRYLWSGLSTALF